MTTKAKTPKLPVAASATFALAKKEVEGTKQVTPTILKRIDGAFLPIIEELDTYINAVAALSIENPNDCEAAKRAALDLGRLASKLKTVKKEEKKDPDVIIKYIDSLYNIVETKLRTTQKDAQEKAEVFIRQAKERIAELTAKRRADIIEYVENPIMLDSMDLASLDEASFSNLVLTFKVGYEERKRVAEEAEKLRIQQEAEAALQKQRKEELYANDLWRFVNNSPDQHLGKMPEKEYLLLKKEAQAFKEAAEKEAERNRLEAEAAAQKLETTKTRIGILTNVGLVYDGNMFTFRGKVAADASLIDLDEKEFTKQSGVIIKKVTEFLAKEKAEKEKAAEKERKEKEAAEALQAKLKAQAEAAEKILAEKAAEQARIAKMKAEEAKAPEINRMLNFVNSVNFTLDTPIIKDANLAAKLEEIKARLVSYKNWATKLINDEKSNV